MSQPKAASGSLGAEDALADIDMELLQDAVQRDELAGSVQNVRRFQEDARKQTLDGQARPDYRAIASRQFQINEMLLTLLQELATRQRGLELELRLAPPASSPAASPVAAPIRPSAQDESRGGDLAPDLGPDFDDDLDLPRPPSEALVRRLDVIQSAMRDDALALQLEVTPTETPVVGKLLGNLRTAVHSLVVFYGNQLAARQTEVNRVLGSALQGVMLESERDRARTAAAQAELAAEVAAELASLRARLDALESR